MTASPARPRSVDRPLDVIAVGVPTLAIADEDREELEDILAELLVAELKREAETPR